MENYYEKNKERLKQKAREYYYENKDKYSELDDAIQQIINLMKIIINDCLIKIKKIILN